TRFLACTLYQPGPGGNPVYVHSKAAVIDDTWVTIGSANLNEHSLFNDTEANVIVRDPTFAREVRLRLWEEHLERPREEIDGDPDRREAAAQLFHPGGAGHEPDVKVLAAFAVAKHVHEADSLHRADGALDSADEDTELGAQLLGQVAGRREVPARLEEDDNGQ